jgi:hypothetical protein
MAQQVEASGLGCAMRTVRQKLLDERKGPREWPHGLSESIGKRAQSHGSSPDAMKGALGRSRRRHGTLGSAFGARTSQTGAIVLRFQAARGERRGTLAAGALLHRGRERAVDAVHASRRAASNALPSPRSSVHSSAAPTVA